MLDEGRRKSHEGTGCRCIYYQIEAMCGTTNHLLIEERKEERKDGEERGRNKGQRERRKEQEESKLFMVQLFPSAPL